MPVHQVLSVVLALFWTVIAEPDAQALLGDDQCEGAGQCALSALQRRGVKKAEDEIRAEEELAAFIEDSIKASRGEQKAVAILPFQTFLRRFLAEKAQSLPALEQINEEVLVNYTHLQSMGCFAKPQEYRLSWRAAGRDFFDQFTFVEQDDTHGAQRYLTKEQAFKNHVISISNGGSAILRIGDLIPTGDPGAPYKRNSVMIHSNYAWAPSTGMLVVMKYNHVPYGASIWPAFWLMNSDNVWPKGGEFDIMEYANDEASKITFHADRNCMLDNRKLGYCMRGKHMGGPGPSNCNTNYWKNLFGCRPRQVQKNGQWYAKNPGVMAAAWDDEGITVYHIPENRIPADLKDDKPRPEGWGEFVVAYLPMEHHSCKNIAQPQEIVLNIALCGDWAGNGWFRSGEARRTGFTRGCGPLIFEPTRDCCSQFATSRDHRIEDMFRRQAYFDIDYLKVFAPVHAQSPQTSGVKRRGGQLLH